MPLCSYVTTLGFGHCVLKAEIADLADDEIVGSDPGEAILCDLSRAWRYVGNGRCGAHVNLSRMGAAAIIVETARGPRLVVMQGAIELKTGGAIGAKDRRALSHLEIHMWMISRRCRADAVECSDTDLDNPAPSIVQESRDSVTRGPIR